jgi:very-short-patch-repair endonuclease
MRCDARSSCLRLAQAQGGVITRIQGMELGLSPDVIRQQVRAGRWRAVRRGVYVVFSGPLNREAVLWAAVCYSGTDAALSHQTAAELHKISDRPSELIHVTIPDSRRVCPSPGLVIHHSRRIVAATHPALRPPRTRVVDTVLNLVAQAKTLDDAFGIVSASCQRRLTTAALLMEAMDERPRIRWRSEMSAALGDISVGVHSVLEYLYVARVERAHGLPVATRQANLRTDRRNRYLDNLYEEYGLCVELDGKQAHPEDQRWQDLRRINDITEKGLVTLRYGWLDVRSRQCQTAGQIGSTLTKRGWTGSLRRCGPDCQVPPLSEDLRVLFDANSSARGIRRVGLIYG